MHLKHFILLAVAIVLCPVARAQDFSAQTYPMVINSEALYTITLPDTIIANGEDSTSTQMLAIGFHFQFCGQVYDSFSANVDGFIRLGNLAYSDTLNNLDSTRNAPLIAPYWDDITTGTTGNVITQLAGTFPNRKRIIQWHVTLPKNITDTASVVFQAVLFEHSGAIKFIYPAIPANPAKFSTGLVNYMNNKKQKIDIRNNNSTAYYNVVSPQTNTGGVAAKSYTFYPDSSKPSKPVKLYGHAGTDCAVLSWSDSSIQEVIFNVYRSSDNISFQSVGIVNSTSSTALDKRYIFHDSNLQLGQTYYYRLTANTMGGYPSDTAAITVTALGPISGVKSIPNYYYNITEAYEHIKCAQLDGPLILELTNSYDTLAESFPISIDGNYNFSSSNTLTIRPASNVTQPIVISAYPADSTAFVVSHTDYFTIDGKPGGTGAAFMLQVRSLKSINGTITFTKEASHNALKNLMLPAGNVFNQKGTVNLISNAGALKGVNNNLITNCDLDCRFVNTTALVYLRSDASFPNDSNTIENSNIRNYTYRYGVLIDKNNSNTLIRGNSFYHTKRTLKLADLCVIDTVGGDVFILNNYFGGSQPYTLGLPDTNNASYSHSAGISTYLNTHQNCSIQGNVFSNLVTGTSFLFYYTAILATGGNNAIGTIEGNIIGDTLNYKIHFSNVTGIACEISQTDSVGIFEVANNLICGINFGTGFDGIRIGVYTTLAWTGRITANVHHNRIGNENFKKSIQFVAGANSPSLQGIVARLRRVQGVVEIADNTLINFYGYDTLAGFNNAAYIAGILIEGKVASVTNSDPLDVYSLDTIKVINNLIKNFLTSRYGIWGINCWTRKGGQALISGNKVKNLTQVGGIYNSSMGGIGIAGDGLISKNIVTTLFCNSLQCNVWGLSTTGIVNVTNNLVSLGFDPIGNSSTERMTYTGLSMGYDSAGAVAYNNSIFIGGSCQTTEGSVCVRFVNVNPLALPKRIKNNIFYNSREHIGAPYGAATDFVYGLTAAPVDLANNVYYFSGTGTALTDSIIPNDTTSLINDPLFIHPGGNSDSIDLHLSLGSPALQLGLASPFIPDDIENTPRPQTGKIDAGCYQSLYVIPPSPIPSVITASGPTVFCAGGSVILSVPNQAGAVYQWKRDGINIGTDSNLHVAALAGAYTVEVTNIYGTFTSSNSITIVINNPPGVPVITPGDTAIVCSGDSLTLTSSAALTYHWSNNATSQSTSINHGGNYNVTVSNGYNCSASSLYTTVILSTTNYPIISPSGPLKICNGGSVTLTSTSSSYYHWSTNDTTRIITVTQPGTYTVTISNAYNCHSVATPLIITLDSNKVATITPNGPITFCNGGSVTLGAPAGLSYHWSNSDSIKNILVTQSGTYSVTVDLGYGCKAISGVPVSVTVLPKPTASISTINGNLFFCTGDSLNLTAPPGLTYHWNNNSVNQYISATQTGTYRVTVTNGNTCSASASISVIASQLPIVTLGGNADTLCSNSALTTLTGGSPIGGIYSGNGVLGNTFNPTTAGVGLHSITYIFSDSHHCTNTASENILVIVCTDVEELPNDYSIEIYPNPASDQLFIETSGIPVIEINIYNITGSLVSNIRQPLNRIDVSQLAEGVYIAEMKTKEASARRRWVKM
jgi:hypothetical protein